MRRSILLSIVLFVCLFIFAYAAKSAQPAEDLHGAKEVKPGSYEDWCGEHGVPESLCTRCDKALVPAFKATGDWDEKHGMPKSQCRKCNPKLNIVRPPKGSK